MIKGGQQKRGRNSGAGKFACVAAGTSSPLLKPPHANETSFMADSEHPATMGSRDNHTRGMYCCPRSGPESTTAGGRGGE